MTAIVGKRCLVVEDEVLIAIDIQRVLEEAGAAAVVCAHTLEEAAAALRRARFDFALLDLRLSRDETTVPLMQTLEAAGTPFVLLTGTELDRAVGGGFAAAVVEKPYTTPILLEAVSKALSAAG